MTQKLKKYTVTTLLLFLLPAYCYLQPTSYQLLTSTVFADENVSATVPPRPSDFQFLFTSDQQGTIRQGSTLTYHITYGAKQSAGIATTTTIVADWSSDTAPNNAQLLDYIAGSATKAYGDVTPVVNPAQHTITWTIPSLPAGVTDQSVTFSLATNSNYSDNKSVNFTILAGMSNQYLTLDDQNITQTYKYYVSPPGPKPTPTVTPTPQQTPSPTQTNTSTALQITNVGFSDISQSAATVSLSTTHPARLSVSYGSSPTALYKTVTYSQYSSSATITIPDLKPATTYYMKVVALSLDGQKLNSEIFTFQTAKNSILPALDDNVIVVTSNNNVSFSGTQKQNATEHPATILTVNSSYEISYILTRPIAVKSIEAIVQNKVLGANTVTGIPSSGNLVIPMQERTQNLYTADLKAISSGSYEVSVQIIDTYGNVIRKKITDLKIMPQLTVYAQDTHSPLADARIFISYYDLQEKKYLPITQAFFGSLSNPSYTDSLGESKIVLPPGKYRVEESALFYDKTVVDFTIGLGANQNFPTIYLKRDSLNIISFAIFMKDYLSDSWNKIISTLQVFSTSIRIFHLISVAILGSFVVISFLLFLLRSRMHVKHLPIFLLFHLDWLLGNHKQKYLFGKVLDENKKPISYALVEIEDVDTKNIIGQMYTNKSGKFYFRNSFGSSMSILVTKEGYELTTIDLEKNSEIPDEGLSIMLEKGKPHHLSFFHFLMQGIGEILGLLFEVSMMTSIILELLFVSIYGIEKTLIYFLLSFINITLWLFYLHENKSQHG